MKVTASHRKNINTLPSINSGEQGFSVSELLTVIVIVMLLSALSLPYMFNYTKLYKSEDQALKVMDLMREAGQQALNKRRTFRLEIDLTLNAVLIIDENTPDPDDDFRIKTIPLDKPIDVRIDIAPDGVTAPAPPNYANAVFDDDSIGHEFAGESFSGNMVWQARFRSDGSVIDAAGNPINATLYSWPPITEGGTAARPGNGEVRAITMFGGTGVMRYWKHNGEEFVPYQ